MELKGIVTLCFFEKMFIIAFHVVQSTNDVPICSSEMKESVNSCTKIGKGCWAADTSIKWGLPAQFRRCSSSRTRLDVRNTKQKHYLKTETLNPKPPMDSPIRKSYINFRDATRIINSTLPFKLEGVLTLSECAELISICKELKTDSSLWPDQTKFTFSIFISQYLADIIRYRVFPFIPNNIQGHRVTKISEVFYFKTTKPRSRESGKHTDRITFKNDYSEFTYLNMIIYLNENSTGKFNGGATELYSDRGDVHINFPVTGSILFYPYDMKHRGQKIKVVLNIFLQLMLLWKTSILIVFRVMSN